MSIYYPDIEKTSAAGGGMNIEKNDPSLNGQMAESLGHEFALSIEDLSRLFLSPYGIDYIGRHFAPQQGFRVVTHAYKTNTCFEKAELLGSWDPLHVIKALYFECSTNDCLYAAVIPETGCFVNRVKLKNLLNLTSGAHLKKAASLPKYMNFGTCSPFICGDDLKENGGKVEKILFDSETLNSKKTDKTLDDFSFGLDHRMSIQMNYYECFRMMKKLYPEVVVEEKLLDLSFKEKLRRINGKINISYEFNSLNYRTAKFINSIHGYGDVSIYNDYVDELELPHVLTGKNSHPASAVADPR